VKLLNKGECNIESVSLFLKQEFLIKAHLNSKFAEFNPETKEQFLISKKILSKSEILNYRNEW